jgi:hypothetical protein
MDIHQLCDGKDRLPSKAHRVHRQFSARHSGRRRIQWRKQLNLLRICQQTPAHEILATWFTIDVLRKLWPSIERRAKSGSRRKRSIYVNDTARAVL